MNDSKLLTLAPRSATRLLTYGLLSVATSMLMACGSNGSDASSTTSTTPGSSNSASTVSAADTNPASTTTAGNTSSNTTSTTTPTVVPFNTAEPMKNVGHVFVIVLENKDYAATFGANSAAPYLAKDLVAQGAMLTNYYGVAHNSNPNYLALISGQGPNPQTQADCPVYTDFIGNSGAVGPNGQAIGTGCVYPSFVKTLPNQLSEKKISWKGYMQDMGKNPAREPATCGRLAINKQDGTQSATATDQYATRHNPFAYFHSIIDDASCDTNVVELNALQRDLSTVNTTARYNLIVPNLCNDGHDAPCKDGAPGGLTSINDFLKTWVPRITASDAFRQDGLLMIIFDEADLTATPSASLLSASGLQDKAGACCNGPTDVSVDAPLPGIIGQGGGRTGAVFLSPFIKPGTVSTTPYNHYALLRSVENGFGVPYLGFANSSSLKTFGLDVFTNPVIPH